MDREYDKCTVYPCTVHLEGLRVSVRIDISTTLCVRRLNDRYRVPEICGPHVRVMCRDSDYGGIQVVWIFVCPNIAKPVDF